MRHVIKVGLARKDTKSEQLAIKSSLDSSLGSTSAWGAEDP